MRENFGYVNAHEDKNSSTFIVDNNKKLWIKAQIKRENAIVYLRSKQFNLLSIENAWVMPQERKNNMLQRMNVTIW